MIVIDDRAGLVAADAPVTQYAVPVFGIAGTAGGSDVESLVKRAGDCEYLASERHVGARANFPCRATIKAIRGEELRSKIDALVAAAKFPVSFKMPLRLGFQFGRQHQPRHRHHVGP